MSGHDRSIEPRRRSETQSERGLATRSDAGDRTVAELASLESPVTVEAESMTVTLLGVPHVAVSEFVYRHRLDASHEQGETRPIAMFDIENTSDRPFLWQSARTKFIGDDDYTYQESPLSLDPGQLGPGCHTRQVEVEPGRRARLVTMVERLPAGVDVSEVVHTLALRGHADSQRLVFPVQ